MIKIRTEGSHSINDLVRLAKEGLPVTLTSHPGNASLYKLALWSCGVPEHLWDITCCRADANNWPMHRLVDGRAELMVSEELFHRAMTKQGRFVTAYQHTNTGERLGRVHVRAMEQHFPGTISSCSRLILSERERVYEMFDYLARTKRFAVFTRRITSDGRLEPLYEQQMPANRLAQSFMNVLEELDHLLFDDREIVTKGGACYEGAMVSLTDYLVQYWQNDRCERIDVSGPDMINYALRPEHARDLSSMLEHLRKWRPELIPPRLDVCLLPGTVARVGHVEGHPSEAVMRRKIAALQPDVPKEEKSRLIALAREDESIWPVQIQPSKVPYFSQHDLCAGRRLSVDQHWRDIPLVQLRDTLVRARNILRI